MKQKIVVIAIALLFAFPFLSFNTFGDEKPVFELDMFCPTGTEGFSIANITYYEQDLKGYYVSDKEGKITFTESIKVPSRSSITVMTKEPPAWMYLSSYYLTNSNGIVAESKFALNDNGDDLYLYDKDNREIDSVSYGDNSSVTKYKLPKIPKGKVAARNHIYGEDGETELWKIHVPGRTLYHYVKSYENAEIIPFSFPESDGSEIAYAIQEAKKSIKISIYMISSDLIFSALDHSLKNGVSVEILIEGEPVGGIPNKELDYLEKIEKSGANIKVIKKKEDYKRYDFVHSKYSIIDDNVTIITSENWNTGSFEGNRGWGVVIYNKECNEYLTNIFNYDFDDKYDIIPFNSFYSNDNNTININPHKTINTNFKKYSAIISPVISPDYSEKTLYNFISSSNERLYSQQLSVEYSWSENDDDIDPLSLMKKLSENNVDTRLIIDCTYDKPDDDNNKDSYGIYSKYANTNFKVKCSDTSKYTVTHNKGIISDNKVWIGSMNWTNKSITSNREVCVIIDSEEVANYYSNLFLQDWGKEFDGNVVLNIEYSKQSDNKWKLDASSSSLPDGCKFYWDFDNDGKYDKSGSVITWNFYNKEKSGKLIVVDSENNVYEKTFTVSENKGDLLVDLSKYLPLVALCIILYIVVHIKKSK